MKIRTEFSSTAAFVLANKVGFSTDTVTDQAIKSSLGKLAMLAATGHLKIIPASASVDEVREAVPCLVGQENSKDIKAAAKAGKLIYHVIPTYMRVFESGSGDGRSGRETAQFEGFGDIDSDLMIP